MAYRYTYRDIGRHPAGAAVCVHLRGKAANVMLLDARNFALYRAGQRFIFVGGFVRRSPVLLSVPEDDHWFLVLDHGGFRGRMRVQEVTVLPPGRVPRPQQSQRPLGEMAPR